METVYVVVTARHPSGDVAGASFTKDRMWFSHMSSSDSWLLRDCTGGFSDRKKQLDDAYGEDGWEAVLVDTKQVNGLPVEIQHHFFDKDNPPPPTTPVQESPLDACAIDGHEPSSVVRDGTGMAVRAVCYCGSVSWLPFVPAYKTDG